MDGYSQYVQTIVVIILFILHLAYFITIVSMNHTTHTHTHRMCAVHNVHCRLCPCFTRFAGKYDYGVDAMSESFYLLHCQNIIFFINQILYPFDWSHEFLFPVCMTKIYCRNFITSVCSLNSHWLMLNIVCPNYIMNYFWYARPSLTFFDLDV